MTSEYPSPKSVRFSEAPQIYEITSLEDLSYEEKQALWYDKIFVSDAKDNNTNLALLMSTGMIREGEANCMRGLESRTEDASYRRNRRRVNTISAVLDEQNRQLTEGVYRPELIAHTSTELTARSQQQAYEMGLKDEKEVLLSQEDLILGKMKNGGKRLYALSSIFKRKGRISKVFDGYEQRHAV